jgi:hypothetical protein
MDDFERVIAERPEQLLAVLSHKLAADGSLTPVIDAVSSLEAAARVGRVSIGDADGMPWVRYRSFAVGLRAVLGCLGSILGDASHSTFAEHAREIEERARLAGGLVEAGVLGWALQHAADEHGVNGCDVGAVRALLLAALWDASGGLVAFAGSHHTL